MKRRIPTCCALTGWLDPKEMVQPIVCRKRASVIVEEPRGARGICPEHHKWNTTRALTIVRPDGSMLTLPKNAIMEE